ncbi:MAG TPA: NAD-dependent epimerase/dehydratase family protein [Acidimicrobiia bacterium]|nr:NAD-dependent epimerase/dehydratase family protein [Acidimicrobiia bacterium]
MVPTPASSISEVTLAPCANPYHRFHRIRGRQIAHRAGADGRWAVDDLNALSYDPRLKECRLEDLQKRGGLQFVRAGLNEGTWAESVLGEFDAIIRLVARAGVRQSLEDPAAYYRTNVDGTLKLLDFAHRRSIPKVVLASTSSV